VLEQVKAFEENKERIDLLMHLMLLLFRDILMIKEFKDTSYVTNSDLMTELERLSGYISYEGIDVSIKEILKAKKSLLGNANFELTIETMLLKINDCRRL